MVVAKGKKITGDEVTKVHKARREMHQASQEAIVPPVKDSFCSTTYNWRRFQDTPDKKLSAVAKELATYTTGMKERPVSGKGKAAAAEFLDTFGMNADSTEAVASAIDILFRVDEFPA